MAHVICGAQSFFFIFKEQPFHTFLKESYENDKGKHKRKMEK